MIVKSCLHVIIGSLFFYITKVASLMLRNTPKIYRYEVSDLSFVCLKGFGTAISSSAPLLGGTLTTGFGATQGLGSSTFGQQPTTGTILTKIKGVYYQVTSYCFCISAYTILALVHL